MIIFIYFSVIETVNGRFVPADGSTLVSCIPAATDGPSDGKTYTNIECICANHSALFVYH